MKARLAGICREGNGAGRRPRQGYIGRAADQLNAKLTRFADPPKKQEGVYVQLTAGVSEVEPGDIGGGRLGYGNPQSGVIFMLDI